MELREIIYTTGLNTIDNKCELIPEELIQAFLEACSPEARTYWLSRPYEDQQLHAAQHKYHEFSLKEAERLGYKESEVSLIGRSNWVIVASVDGDAEGHKIAEQYGFDGREVVLRGNDVRWGVIGWRRDKDAIIFVGANQGTYRENGQDKYHVGVVWAPELFVRQYQDYSNMPYVLI